LEDKVRGDLEEFVRMGERLGFYAEYRYALGTDLILELEGICLDLVKEFRKPVVFAGQLVFQRENLFTRSLHHETAFSIQRRLQFNGVQTVILPMLEFPDALAYTARPLERIRLSPAPPGTPRLERSPSWASSRRSKPPS